MTPDDRLYRFRQRTLALAEELGSVRAACRMMGIHHSTFYRWRRDAERYGLEMLRPRERRPPRMPNATSAFVEQRVVAFALGQPGFGPARIAAELARPKWGGIKSRPPVSGGCCGATVSTPAASASASSPATPPLPSPLRASLSRSATWRPNSPVRWCNSTASTWAGCRDQGHRLAVHGDRCRLRQHLG